MNMSAKLRCLVCRDELNVARTLLPKNVDQSRSCTDGKVRACRVNKVRFTTRRTSYYSTQSEILRNCSVMAAISRAFDGKHS